MSCLAALLVHLLSAFPLERHKAHSALLAALALEGAGAWQLNTAVRRWFNAANALAGGLQLLLDVRRRGDRAEYTTGGYRSWYARHTDLAYTPQAAEVSLEVASMQAEASREQLYTLVLEMHQLDSGISEG